MITVCATYVWVDPTGHLRSKYRCLEFDGEVVFPQWTTEQAPPLADVTLVPVRVVKDPFAPVSKIHDALVLCECLHSLTDLPIDGNTRARAKEAFTNGSDVHPWFGITQEYLLCAADTGQPYMWQQLFSDTSVPKQGHTHCGVGLPQALGRDVAVEHLHACLAAGLKVTSMHAGTTPAQWAFQLAPLEGLAAADELWLARYILEIVCERHGLKVVWHPKPKKRFPGSACYVTYSNTKTREVDEGLTEIMLVMNNLSKRHAADVLLYGSGNDLRLSTAAFTFGFGDRGASVRIPHRVLADKCGYFEDRRPGANADPYTVLATLHTTAIQI